MDRAVRSSAHVPRVLIVVLAVLAGLVSPVVAAASPQPPVTPNAQSYPNDNGVRLPYDAVDRSFRPVIPTRLLDTRQGSGAIGPNGYGSVDVTGRAGIPVDGVGAVVLNVTAVSPTAGGYLRLFASTTAEPVVSDVNFVPGQNVANPVLVDLVDTGSVEIHNVSGGSVHVVVDVAGYYLAGTAASPGAYQSVVATRVLDTRSGNGAPQAAVKPGETVRVRVTGVSGVSADAVAAVALNVTATAPTGSGYVTAWPDGSPRPTASTLNFDVGRTVPNLAIVPVGAGGVVDLYNGSAGTVQLLADVRAYFLSGTPSAQGTLEPTAPLRVLDTRSGKGAARGPVAAGATVHLGVAGPVDQPGTSRSVVLNLTVTAATGGGYLSTWAHGATRPVVSSLNFVRGRTVAVLVVVQVGDDGGVEIYNGSPGTVQIVADLTGRLLGEDRSVVVATPAPGTVVATADQVMSGSVGTDGSTTTTLAPDLTPPAVGGGLVAPETASLATGVAGRVTSVVRLADGGSSVTTTPVSLDQLYADLDVSVNRNLLASDVVGAPPSPPGTPAPPTGFGGSTAADFTCTEPDGSRSLRTVAVLSRLHLDVALDSARRSTHVQLSTSARIISDYVLPAGTRCVLTANDGELSTSLHIAVTSTPPIHLDVTPTFTVTSTGAATMTAEVDPYVAVGFDRGNGHDSDTRHLAGTTSATASGAANVDLGLATSMSVAGRAVFGGTTDVTVGVTDRGRGCSALRGTLATSYTATAGVLFPTAPRPSSGPSAGLYLRGCDWDEFPLLVDPTRVGNALVGDATASVSQAVGVPLRLAGPTGCRRLETTDNRSDAAARLDPTGTRVTVLFASRWVTAEGIRTGSTWAQVHTAYPSTQLLTVPGTARLVTYIDRPDGTSLRLDMGYPEETYASFAYAGSRADVRAVDSCG